MNITRYIRSFKFILATAMMLFSFQLVAQECKVEKAEIRGTYTGNCKKGLANGKGKSVGTDTYEGNFRSGLPNGIGIYTWSNGNQFTGEFSNGMKEGKGKLIFKRANKEDSVITGFWKKDAFAGVNEHPYRIINKSKLVTDIEVEYKTDPYNKITFFITNTSGGASTFDDLELPKLKIDEVRAMTGAYGRLYVNDNHVKKTESIIEEVNFPFRMKAIIGTEEIEVEFFEAGTYILNVRIND